MISQFFTHGFAIYVIWNLDNGTRGRDQFGDIWEKRGGYAYDENNVFKFRL